MESLSIEKKIELCKTCINFLGVTLGEGKIKIQPHITKKILEMPDKLKTLKELQSFLGLVNYAKTLIKNLGKKARPLYAKTGKASQKHFNTEDIKLVQQIKSLVSKLPDLALPLDSDYIIIETDGCNLGWGVVLKARQNKYNTVKEDKLYGYASGNFKEKGYISSIDAKPSAIIYASNGFKLTIINKKEKTIKTECKAITKFHNKKDEKASSRRRWINFQDRISILTINFKHIRGKDNYFLNQLSRGILDYTFENNMMNIFPDSLMDPRTRPQPSRRLTFGKESLISFPQDYNLVFKIRDTTKYVTEEQKYLIDNLWISYHKTLKHREPEKEYFVTCINSLK